MLTWKPALSRNYVAYSTDDKELHYVVLVYCSRSHLLTPPLCLHETHALVDLELDISWNTPQGLGWANEAFLAEKTKTPSKDKIGRKTRLLVE
jgi:hypothetical protein